MTVTFILLLLLLLPLLALLILRLLILLLIFIFARGSETPARQSRSNRAQRVTSDVVWFFK